MKFIYSFHFIFFLILFISGNNSLACSSTHMIENKEEVKRSCCEKSNSKREKKDPKKHSSTKKHNCGGNCEDGSCHCVHVTNFTNLPNSNIWKDNFNLPMIEKSIINSFFKKPTSGFYYIWTPPNIS